MAHTANGNLTGQAAVTNLRDQREWMYAQQRKADRVESERRQALIEHLYGELLKVEGRTFERWWDSDAVPAEASKKEYIALLENRMRQVAANLLQSKSN